MLFQLDRFHHLSDKTVCHDDCGIAILVRQVEGQHREIGHLLHGRWREHDVAVVAVSPAFHYGEVVALLGSDIAQARAAAHYIDNHARQLRPSQI